MGSAFKKPKRVPKNEGGKVINANRIQIPYRDPNQRTPIIHLIEVEEAHCPPQKPEGDGGPRRDLHNLGDKRNPALNSNRPTLIAAAGGSAGRGGSVSQRTTLDRASERSFNTHRGNIRLASVGRNGGSRSVSKSHNSQFFQAQTKSNSTTQPLVSLSPIPTNDKLFVWGLPLEAFYQWEVRDLVGKQYSQGEQVHPAHVPIEIGTLSQGVYVLQLSLSNGSKENLRFVVAP